MVSRSENRNVNNTYSLPFLLLLGTAVSDVRQWGMYLLLAVGGLFFAVQYDCVKVPRAVLPVTIFACCYFLFCLPHHGLVSAAKIFLCPLLWLMGYNMPEGKKVGSLFAAVAILAFGMGTHGLLNYLYNALRGVSMSSGRTMDIWSGTISSATGQAIHFTLFLAVAFWLLFVQKKRWVKAISLGMLFASIMYGIQLGSRSFFVLMVIAIAAGMLSYLFERGQRRRLWYLLGSIAVLTAAFLVLYHKNVWGMQTYIQGSYLFHRMNWSGDSFFAIASNSRFSFKKAYLKNMAQALWGGGVIRGIVGSYAHDLWLDIFADAGIVTLMALLIYSLCALFRIVRTRKDPRLTSGEKAALLSYGLTLYAQFFTEPIWQGGPMLFCSFVLMDGMLAQFSRPWEKGDRV